MTECLGWKGKRVKHTDGRTGVIQTECRGFCFVGLKIAVDESDATDWVQLNTNSSDTGAKGWHWDASFEGEATNWLPLGDHNAVPA